VRGHCGREASSTTSEEVRGASEFRVPSCFPHGRVISFVGASRGFVGGVMSEDGPYEIELVPLPPEVRPAPGVVADRPGVAKVVTEDEEIYCPVCGYNLSGIFRGRCPECGAFFDRSALIAAQQANAITLIPWDDPQEAVFWERLYRTVRICLLDAERFAFAFSVQPRESKAGSFFVGATAATTVIGVLAALAFMLRSWIDGNPNTALSDSLLAICFIGAFIPLTMTLATVATGVFLWVFCPHYDGQRHFRPWLSIAAYAAAHYLMMAAAVPVAWVLPLMSRSGEFEFWEAMACIWAGCGLLCVFTLRAVIDWRTSDVDSPRFLVFLIAFIHFAAGLVSFFLAVAFAGYAVWVVRLF
jgi:hypothetical protein